MFCRRREEGAYKQVGDHALQAGVVFAQRGRLTEQCHRPRLHSGPPIHAPLWLW